uniref:Uncharacterized protein n=1 Tax=Candidatus Kentrum sp. LFY TaxID=2126342 RepID=A0A450WQA2_9GAMM|nr:MAG: hypothetical protein BECKLFY1418C_GA0070996_105518 [Candidatus Kentron sp. LFY]
MTPYSQAFCLLDYRTVSYFGAGRGVDTDLRGFLGGLFFTVRKLITQEPKRDGWRRIQR